MFQNGTKSSATASFLRGSRLRLRVKISMRLWRLRRRINIFTRIFDAAPLPKSEIRIRDFFPNSPAGYPVHPLFRIVAKL
jgi:hypothetical protein